jgi:methylamine--corrinoid protein Co-methyltransferase
MSIQQFVEILDRAHTGPICSLPEWDLQRVPQAIRAKLKKYELANTFTPDEPVNCDDDLADRFFRAGYEAAHELGVYCQDTERIISISEEELHEAIERAPRELRLGRGTDQVVMRSRRPEDGVPPLGKAPLGIVVAEEYWVPLHVGIALIEEVDILQGGSLATVFGRPLRGGTPFETLAGRLQAQLHREALWRAGRPGMPASAVITSPTAFGQLGGFGTPGGFSVEQDAGIILAPSEMKTTYDALHKAAHAIGMNATVMGSASPMIGGYAGPPEGAAVVGIAWSLAQYAVHFVSYGSCSGMDIRVNTNTNRAGLWTLTIINQALSRNTDLLIQSLSNQLGGPMTEQLLWESAAVLTALSASGISVALFPRTAGGRYANHLSPLECKFCGKVLKAAAGLSREQANEIVKQCLPHYEHKHKNPDPGVPFWECYDVKALSPKPEWQAMYDQAVAAVTGLGVPIRP